MSKHSNIIRHAIHLLKAIVFVLIMVGMFHGLKNLIIYSLANREGLFYVWIDHITASCM